MSLLEVTLRVLLAAFLGGLIGAERQSKGRPAGFRTHILVSVGSALFMIISVLVSTKYSQFGPIDPTRIAAGVVTGVGFLGAGAVMRMESGVQGLTTAASIWAMSAIGLTAGAGFYLEAIVVTFIVLVALILFRVEVYFDERKCKKKD